MEENEMIDYEKKYNEALERAQKVTRAGGDVAMVIVQDIFPELAESEDERIRKWIASYIHHGVFTEDEHPMALKAVEWLEKQKEQKPEDRFEEAREKYQVEWSDEDENIRQSLILLVSNDKINGYTEFYKAQEITCDKVIAFLKSLRPSWKPSEEQMEALERTIRLANFGLEEDRRKALESLHDQLKKLM